MKVLHSVLIFSIVFIQLLAPETQASSKSIQLENYTPECQKWQRAWNGSESRLAQNPSLALELFKTYPNALGGRPSATEDLSARERLNLWYDMKRCPIMTYFETAKIIIKAKLSGKMRLSFVHALNEQFTLSAKNDTNLIELLINRAIIETAIENKTLVLNEAEIFEWSRLSAEVYKMSKNQSKEFPNLCSWKSFCTPWTAERTDAFYLNQIAEMQPLRQQIELWLNHVEMNQTVTTTLGK